MKNQRMVQFKKFLCVFLFMLFVTPSKMTFSAVSNVDKIKVIKNINVIREEGDNYTLPKTVTAVMENGKNKSVSITWNANKAITDKQGKYIFKGKVKGYNKSVELVLNIIPCKIEIEENNKQLETGNTSGNIGNGSIAVQKDEWIYFVKKSGAAPSELYKVKLDGTEQINLSKNSELAKNLGDITCINIVGEWIYFNYYRFSDAKACIYKMKIDGSNLTNIIDGYAKYINVAGEWIYYINDSKIYKIKTDGTQNTKVCNNEAHQIYVKNEWIYFTDNQDRLHKMKIDGTSITKLGKNKVYNFSVAGDWIFFRNRIAVDAIIYKIKIDGTKESSFYNISGFYTNISGGWLYYSGYKSKRGSIYKIKLDGTQNIKIITSERKSYNNINVVGNWIFGNYTYPSEGMPQFFRIKTDGTEK